MKTITNEMLGMQAVSRGCAVVKKELGSKEKRTEPGRFVSWVGWVKKYGWVITELITAVG
jgi:hypothetical protein